MPYSHKQTLRELQEEQHYLKQLDQLIEGQEEELKELEQITGGPGECLIV